jgi:hypothetical protein
MARTPKQRVRYDIFWKIGIVRMWYAVNPKTDTPIPFAEFRVFIFCRRKPRTITEKLLLIDKLKKKLDTLILLTTTGFQDAEGGGFIYGDDTPLREVEVKVKKKQIGKMMVEINGHETEPLAVIKSYRMVNKEPVQTYIFKTIPRPIELYEKYGTIYRYMAFFDKFGLLKRDYDEFEIRKLEKQVFATFLGAKP